MIKGEIIGADTLATIHGITERVVSLNNKIVEKGIEDISFHFEWSGSCSSVEIHLTHWEKDKIEVVSQEIYTCYYDHDWDGCNLEGLYKTLDEWEARYGLRK